MYLFTWDLPLSLWVSLYSYIYTPIKFGHNETLQKPQTKLLTLPLWNWMCALQRWENICLQGGIFTCAFFILFCFQEIIAAGAGACSPYLWPHTAVAALFSTWLGFTSVLTSHISFRLIFFSAFFFLFSPSHKGRRERWNRDFYETSGVSSQIHSHPETSSLALLCCSCLFRVDTKK